jgi:hypothetical protein
VISWASILDSTSVRFLESSSVSWAFITLSI